MQRELGGSFSGIIDEVRVYDKALTPEVIVTIYQTGKPPSTWYWYVLGFMLLLVATSTARATGYRQSIWTRYCCVYLTKSQHPC